MTQKSTNIPKRLKYQ